MELPVREGDLIAGKYAVERVLGDGGMGVVVAARHLELGERVALKFLLPEALKNPEACLRFVREARAAARIKGEHVARVLDVGTRDDGIPFIVMEYLEGHDLGRIIETRGPLAVSDAVHYVLQACEAVAEAHALGIVHRDLKPANLFLTTSPDGSPLVKVLDFGISKSPSVFARTLSPSITTVNTGMGTPHYMSPEQARDASKVDARSDVWALGAILYELLAGKPAFDADSVPALVMMIATEEPPALENLRPDVPAALVASIRHCLQKNREERFADIAVLARALEAFVPEEARQSVARIARILGHGASEAPPPVESPPSVPGGRLRSVAASFALAAAMLVIGVVVWSKRPSSSSVASRAVEHVPAEAARARQEPPPSSLPTSLAPIASAIRSADHPVTARAASPGTPAAATRTSPPALARPIEHATVATERAAAGQAFTARRPRSSSAFARSLANEPGILTFQSNVPAHVALDGRALGPTPKSVTVAPGSHTVVFVHPELGQKEQAVTLDPGQDKTVRATFQPAAAQQP
jgi:eukaryotic-like serine/threonine-protein kinase